MIKPIFYGENADEIKEIRAVTAWTLDRILVILHPFMPFITEEIYCALPTGEETIMTSLWPEYKEELNFPEEEKEMS